MDDFLVELKRLGFRGEVDVSEASRELYSHDASLFELKPQAIAAPADSLDLQTLVRLVASRKKSNPSLSLTARSGGTCMSGGSINESIIVDFSKHFNRLGLVSEKAAHVQPGVYYRDLEKETLNHGALMPSYPASREICMVGGMVANNSGGEKSLEFGKTERFILGLKAVLADGKEYIIKPLNKAELTKKIDQDDFEGRLYKRVFKLVDKNYDRIRAAKPKVSKDSTGYHLWNVWDRETGKFDLTQLLVGSQGTLGLVTDIKFRLVPHRPYSGTLVIFLRNLDSLGELIDKVTLYHPAAFEGFDNYTLKLSFKLFFYFRKNLGWLGMIKLGFQLIPEVLKLMRGIPKMVLLVEFEGQTQAEVTEKIKAMHTVVESYGHDALFEEDDTEANSRKFWIMRRESFNLLRKKVKDKHTAPFIDDLVVPPQKLQEFLPQLRKIIDKHKLLATVAGHMGDGNFHVIPLMNIEKASERAKLKPAMKEVNELVLKYGGSLSGEHNDGMIRGPWLGKMYGEETLELFKEVKDIFDPDNIFNPHKKTDATWEYSFSHIREKF